MKYTTALVLALTAVAQATTSSNLRRQESEIDWLLEDDEELTSEEAHRLLQTVNKRGRIIPDWFPEYRQAMRKEIKLCRYLDREPKTKFYNLDPETGDKCRKRGNRPYNCGVGNIECADEMDIKTNSGTHPAKLCLCADGVFTCTETCPVDTSGGTTGALDEGLYRSSRGALEVELPYLSDKVTEPYKDTEELKSDLGEMSKFMLNSVINSDAGEQGYTNQGAWGSEGLVLRDVLFSDFAVPMMAAAESVDVAASPQSLGPSAEGVDDFETNNQEEGVDESDTLKANADYVFVAYGDVLMVYTPHQEEWVTNITMPEIDTSSNNNNNGFGFSLYRYNPKPNIRALMLHGDSLIVIVNGYGSMRREAMGITETKVFYNLLETHVRMYDISDLANGNMPLIGTKDINGNFQDARSVGGNAHIVTSTTLRYTDLTTGIRIWNPEFEELTGDDYKEAAAKKAAELIPEFVETFVDELAMTGDEIPDLMKVSLWNTESPGEDAESQIFGGVLFDSYAQVTSLDMTQDNKELEVSLAAAFLPSSWGKTYATDDMLIFATNSWNWFSGNDFTETTYFVGFSLDGASSTPAAIGSTPGTILDQFSMDIYDGHLRVATTINNFRFWWPMPIVIDEPIALVEPAVLEVDANVRRRLEDTESRTKNQFVIFELPTDGSGIMEEVGRIDNIGKPNERFTAVKMFDNIAYAVTFQQTDPYYVLDLSPPTDPKVLGELEITGWSDQLYSLNSDNTLMVSIGQEADERGVRLGFSISLFDSSDPTKPTLLQRLVVEEEKNAYSSSAGSWDIKATRLVKLEDGVGILIIPLTIWAPEDSEIERFDGFVAYNVDVNAITERVSIPHVTSQNFYGCYYRANLPTRNVIYDGVLNTLKRHSVIGTDLDTGETTFELDPYTPPSKDDCVDWVF